jgi:hypothetical protein
MGLCFYSALQDVFVAVFIIKNMNSPSFTVMLLNGNGGVPLRIIGLELIV